MQNVMAGGALSRAADPVGRGAATITAPIRYGFATHRPKERFMTLGTILLIILVLLLLGALPTWGYSRGWGYGPSGILGLVLIVILILFLMGRI
jgi:Protein of unknown function (DUF3309)